MADLNDDIAALQPDASYATQLAAMKRSLRTTAAPNLEAMSRDYQTMSPDLAASLALLDVDSRYQGMGEIMRRDMQNQSWVQNAWLPGPVKNALRGASNVAGVVGRNLTAGMYDLWDAGVSQPLRFGTRTYQDWQDGGDFSLIRSFDQSIGTIAAESASQIAQGNLTPRQLLTGEALGTGVLAGRPDNQYELPGAGQQIQAQLAQNATMAEAMTYTDKWLADKYGADVVNGAWENAEATRIHVTANGVTYDYGVSVGRMFATPLYHAEVLTPGTIPANILTGAIDAGTQIAFDPTDVIFDEMTKIWSAVRKLQPDEITSVDELMEGAGALQIDELDGVATVQGIQFRAGTGTEAVNPLTDNLVEALADAQKHDDAFVHIYNKEDFADVEAVLRDAPELEPYQAFVDEAQHGFDSVVDDFREMVPEFDDALDEGVDVWAARNYLTEDEAAHLADRFTVLEDVTTDFDEAMAGLPRPDSLVEATHRLPVAEVEEMLEAKHLFREGKASMDETLKYVDEDFGVARVRGRLEPKSPDEFLTSRRGENLVAWLADSDIPMYRKVARMRKNGVPMRAVQDMMHGIEDEALNSVTEVKSHLKAWVNGQMLTKRISAPSPINPSQLMYGNVAQIAGRVGVSERVRTWSDWGRRWNAESTTSKINPWNQDATFDTIVQWGATVGASDEAIDGAVNLMYSGANKFESGGHIQSALMDMLVDAWRRNKIDEPIIVETLETYFDSQRLAVLYNVDALANPVAEVDTIFRVMQTPGGNEIRIPANQPLLVSEMGMSTLHVPSIRQARRATTKARKASQKFREARVKKNGKEGHPLLLDDAVAQRLVDGSLAVWRNAQLLRPGWMMSVVPDEVLRAMADGHADLFANPFTAFRVFFQGAGDVLPSGKALDMKIASEGGLGAGVGGLGETLSGESLAIKSGQGKTPWHPIEMYDPETGEIVAAGARAMTEEWMRLYSNPFTKWIDEYDGDLDRLMEFFTQPGTEGRQILNDLRAGKVGGKTGVYPSKDIRLDKLDPLTDEGREALRVMLEATDARIHLLTGGDWLKRDPQDLSKWVDSGGNPVELYDGINPDTNVLWTKTDFDELIRFHVEFVGEALPVGLGRMNKADLRLALLEQNPQTAGLMDLSGSQSYHVFKRGNIENRNLIAGGRASPDMLPFEGQARALSNWGTERGITEGNRMFIVVKDSALDVDYPSVIPSGSRVYKSANRAGNVVSDGERVVMVNMDNVSDEVMVRLLDSQIAGEALDDVLELTELHIRTYDEIAAEGQKLIDDGNQNLLHPEMEGADFDVLTDHIQNVAYSDEYGAPPMVKAPVRNFGGKRESKVNDWIDTWFRWLGTNPSNVVARSPYARIKVWEGFADYHIHASPSIQAEILKGAKEAGFSKVEFQKMIDRQMMTQGYDTAPLPARVQFSLEEIEDIAVARAIEDSRNLFFDLSKRKNMFDATKIIFPFGDAWWEVMTRWGKLFNPVKADQFGRPFKNLSRIESANRGAQRSGWYELDANGERVLKWFPGAALAASILGQGQLGVSNQVALNQVGFINPVDPRSVLGPSMGPVMQSSAALFRPLFEDKAVAPLIDFIVYGSWNPTEFNTDAVVKALLPTYMNRFLKLAQNGDFDEIYASRTIDVVNGLFASDEKYANAVTDASTQKMLLDDARSFVMQYSLIEAAASSISPVQPRLIIEVMGMDQDGAQTMHRLAAVGADLNFLRNQGGMSEEEALATIRQWYGIDPLAIAPKSYSVYQHPVTRSAHAAILQNPEMLDLMPMTLAAFLPEDLEGEFYSPEFQRQIKAGERDVLTARQAWQLVSYRAGADRMEVIREERDMNLRAAEEVFGGKDTDGYRLYRDNTALPWYNNLKRSIETAYFYNVGAGGPTGILKRPTFEKLSIEMLKIGTPGSDENRLALKLNPELTGLLTEVSRLWERNNRISEENAHDASWWHESTSESDPTTGAMRSNFLHKVRVLVDKADDEETKRAFQWYADFVITPLMTGYDFDDPFIVDAEPLTVPGG